MWNLVVLTVLLALAGGYALIGERDVVAQQQGVTAATAEGMAIYRGAVMRYYAANPGMPEGSVSFAMLSAGPTPALRNWSTLEADRWGNYRDAAGLVYIYAVTRPAANISADLARISYGSMLAGSYHEATGTLYSPRSVNTNISLAALAGLNVPDGAPVWLVTAL